MTRPSLSPSSFLEVSTFLILVTHSYLRLRHHRWRLLSLLGPWCLLRQPLCHSWDPVGSFDMRGDGHAPGIWIAHQRYQGREEVESEVHFSLTSPQHLVFFPLAPERMFFPQRSYLPPFPYCNAKSYLTSAKHKRCIRALGKQSEMLAVPGA